MKILLVDACPQQNLQQQLSGNAKVALVDLYNCADEALDAVTSRVKQYDIAVIDHQLPDSANGLELCQKLIQIGVTYPLVLLIEAGFEALLSSAIHSGVEACLHKPTSDEQMSALPTVLKEVVRRHGDRAAREQAVVGLRESHNRLEEIVEASSVPIFVIDSDHRVTEWNRACELLTGLAAHEMLGGRESWRAFYPSRKPTMADLIVSGRMESAIASHSGDDIRKSPLGEGYEAEDYFTAETGPGRWLFVTAAPLRNRLGQNIGAIATLQDVTEVRSAMEKLEKTTSWLNQILDGSAVPAFVIDQNHQLVHWNRACEILTGLPASEVIGSSDQWRAFYPQQRPVMADLLVDNVLEKELARHYTSGYRPSLLGHGYEAEGFFPSLGSSGRWLFITAAPLRSAEGEIVGAIETLQDITDRRVAEVALAENQRRLAQIIQGSVVPTFVLDRQHRISEWNPACEKLTGFTAAQMLGTLEQWKAFSSTQRPVLADLILDAADDVIISRQYRGKARRSVLGEGYEVEDFFPGLGENGKWLFFTAAPLRDLDGNITGAIETLQDVTRRRKAEDVLRASEQHYRELSITDSLTGLFNPRHFRERLGDEIDRAHRYHKPLSLLLLDIDDFKSYNDNYGHPAGDQLLEQFAQLLRNCVRSIDSVYRCGGEEFAVILPETLSSEAKVIAERFLHEFATDSTEPRPGIIVQKTVSIGTTQLAAGEDITTLLRRGDHCLYQAKKNGKNRVELE